MEKKIYIIQAKRSDEEGWKDLYAHPFGSYTNHSYAAMELELQREAHKDIEYRVIERTDRI